MTVLSILVSSESHTGLKTLLQLARDLKQSLLFEASNSRFLWAISLSTYGKNCLVFSLLGEACEDLTQHLQFPFISFFQI